FLRQPVEERLGGGGRSAWARRRPPQMGQLLVRLWLWCEWSSWEQAFLRARLSPWRESAWVWRQRALAPARLFSCAWPCAWVLRPRPQVPPPPFWRESPLAWELLREPLRPSPFASS